jgi:hypothetical protein
VPFNTLCEPPKKGIRALQPCETSIELQVWCPVPVHHKRILAKEPKEAGPVVSIFTLSGDYTLHCHLHAFCSFSNIALKMNTKLANKMNRACAWEIGGYANRQGIPWISEVPTLIFGLATSRGMGKEAPTLVAASASVASLDAHSCMQLAQVLKIQSKSDVVEDHIMLSITKVRELVT